MVAICADMGPFLRISQFAKAETIDKPCAIARFQPTGKNSKRRSWRVVVIYENRFGDGENSPISAVHALFMRDLMHEIGQTISIVGIISFNMNYLIESKEDKIESDLILPNVQNISKAVNDFSEFYSHFRSLGRPVVGTDESGNRWQTAAMRINSLTRLARERNGIVLTFSGEICPPQWNKLVSDLELVILCLVKENVSAWPKNVGGRVEVELVQDAERHGHEPQVRISAFADDEANRLPIQMTETALQVARHFRVMVAKDGAVLALSRHDNSKAGETSPYGLEASRESGPDPRNS
jgi:hypothetical protein